MKLSIVIPIYNEEETVQELNNRLINAVKKDFHSFKYEIIYVDDGSTDNSYSIIKKIHTKNKNVKIIQFSRNFGHHIAISAGLDYVKGDYVIMMDGDLQDKPEEMIKLYKKLKEGYDVVYAVRINKKHSFFKKISSNLFNLIIKLLIKEKMVINSTIFRITTKQVIDNVKLFREPNRYLVGIIGSIGFKHAPQPVEHGERYKGETKYTFSKQLSLAFNAIFSYSGYPIRISLFLGIVLLFIAIIIITNSIISKPSNTSQFFGLEIIITSIFIVGGLQIILIGIIGEFVSRQYFQNKNRPLYIIKNKLI